MPHRHGPRRQTGSPTHPDRSAGAESVLELVVKADTLGTLAALAAAIASIEVQGVRIRIIRQEAGPVSKSDLDLAVTGSRLVLGFGVGVNPRVDQLSRELGVEVRLYDVIYDITRDVEAVAQQMVPRAVEERITGHARVVQLFKSTRKGIILGCQVLQGALAVGKPFRVVAAVGPIYEGIIESLRIEERDVKEAPAGQNVGLKITDFKQAKVGDLVECFEAPSARRTAADWSPSGGVHREAGRAAPDGGSGTHGT